MFPTIHLTAIFLWRCAWVGTLKCWYNVVLLGCRLNKYKEPEKLSFFHLPVQLYLKKLLDNKNLEGNILKQNYKSENLAANASIQPLPS